MKQKVLQLIKILSKFNENDILQMIDIDEDSLTDILQDFEQAQIIKKISNSEYSFIKSLPVNVPIKKEPKNKIYKFEPVNYNLSAINPESLFPEEAERAFFQSCSDRDKKNIIKCITLFKVVSQVRNKHIKEFLKEFGKIHPDYNMAYSTLYRYRKRYYEVGIKGLCYAYAHRSEGKTIINPEMYDLFKKFYLSSSRYTFNEAWLKVQEKYKDDYIPCPVTFRRQLHKELSSESIKQMRNTPIKLPDFKFDDDKNKKEIYFEKFIDAADYFISHIMEHSNSKNIHIRNLKKYIIPYFKDYKFKDVTQKTIIDYENKLFNDGYSTKSINRIISTLSCIYYKFSNEENDISFRANSTILPSNEHSYYNEIEIQKFINKKSPELWILTLGITPAELSCLRYEDISINGTVRISRAVMGGVEQKYRVKYRIRELVMPRYLFNSINNNKKGLIFGNVEIENFNKLLNTHIHLLLKKHIQLHIISKNLGCVNINDFTTRFNYLLDESLNDSFDILEL